MVIASIFVVLFVLGAGFVGARYVARWYFHESRRADAAAACVVLAFALGVLVEMPLRARPPAAPPDTAVTPAVEATPAKSSGTPVAATAKPRRSESPSKPLAQALGMLKEGRADQLFASLDTAEYGGRTVAFSSESFVEVQPGDAVTLVGWARDPVANTLPRAVYVEVDRRLAFLASSSPVDRPDVAAFTHNAALSHAGFTVTLSAAKLGRGTHYPSVLVIGADGKAYYRKGFDGTIAIQVH